MMLLSTPLHLYWRFWDGGLLLISQIHSVFGYSGLDLGGLGCVTGMLDVFLSSQKLDIKVASLITIGTWFRGGRVIGVVRVEE